MRFVLTTSPFISFEIKVKSNSNNGFRGKVQIISREQCAATFEEILLICENGIQKSSENGTLRNTASKFFESSGLKTHVLLSVSER